MRLLNFVNFENLLYMNYKAYRSRIKYKNIEKNKLKALKKTKLVLFPRRI